MSETAVGEDTATSRTGAALLLLGIMLLVGLRVLEAARKSLWIDELHTLHVAAGADLPAAMDRLRPDFHAPLHFLAVHALRAWPPHLLRAVSVLGSVATVLFLLAIAKASGAGRTARIALLAAFAGLPFQIQYGAELRPYSWLALSATALAWGAFVPAPARTRRIAFIALAVAFGLYTHYLAAVAVLAVGAARLFVRDPLLLPLRHLVLGGTIGVLLFVPWVAYDESWIFQDPGVMVRNETGPEDAVPPSLASRIRGAWPTLRDDLVSLPLRLALPSVGRLGPVAGKVALAATALLLLVVTAGLVLRLRRLARPPGTTPSVSGASLAAVLALLLVALLCVVLWQRVALQYLALGAWVIPLLAAAGVSGFRTESARMRAAGLMLAFAAVAGLAHALGSSREDLASGVRKARALAADSGAIVTAVMWQPDHYSALSVYDAYAPDLATTAPLLVPPASAAEPRPVVVLTRNAPFERASDHRSIWGAIPEGREVKERIAIDPAVSVVLLVPAGASGPR